MASDTPKPAHGAEAAEQVAGRLPFPEERREMGVLRLVRLLPRTLLRAPILLYRYTLSSFLGRQCRYLPTCSAYADEAIATHGAGPGTVMAVARICRCNPWGGHGYDPVPPCLPADARWYRPWRYGIWRTPRTSRDEAGADPS